MTTPQVQPADKVSGSFFIAVGAVIVLMCGKCTVGVVGQSLSEATRGPAYERGWAELFLILSPAVGGVPILVGAGLIAFGLMTWRGRPRPTLGRMILGGALMAFGAAVAWISGAILVQMVSNGPAESSFRLTAGAMATATTFGGLAAIWFGWKMLRGSRVRATKRAGAARLGDTGL